MSVAIVTGASRGLGEALAKGLARAGWSLVVDGRDLTTLDAAAERIRAEAAPGAHVVAIVGDITDADHRHDLTAAAFELGGLDLVVNNAGTLGAVAAALARRTTRSTICASPSRSTSSPRSACSRTRCRCSSTRRGPRIVNVTSDAAVEAYEGWGGYGAGKAALEHLGAVLAAEFPALTVWSVDPGDLRTAMHQAAFPGEDISDRPEPASAVPAFVELIGSERPSGRYRAAELVSTGAVA